METLKSKRVGEFVTDDYRTAAVFQKYGIDFCCKGGRTIEEVCGNKNISVDMLLNSLNEVSTQKNIAKIDFQSWPLDRLAEHIEKKHHKYVADATIPLKQFLDKIFMVHGSRHPELFEINTLFNESAAALAQHMKKEELILFPYIKKMVAAKQNNEKMVRPFFGTIQNPVQMMMEEHVTEGDHFARISELSGGYAAPADGCTTYRVAYTMLKEFEEDLHLHIHLENNILFPKSVELEKEILE